MAPETGACAAGSHASGTAVQLTEPENRLVARTLEARWEKALKRQREAEEEYNRFLTQQPATLSSDERHRIGALAESVSQVWNAEGTSAIDLKQIVRCVVERVILVADRTPELNEVTIMWKGGMETKHEVSRPVHGFEQLKDYRKMTERIRDLHAEGLHHFQIADTLNQEGFVPPRRRGKFTRGQSNSGCTTRRT